MVVAKSKKGLETRLRILNTAKQFFYTKGYADTSVKEICDIADVKPGTFSYYFKTKDLLITAIYEDLYLNSYVFVSNNVNKALNSLEKNAIISYVYYLTIFRDEHSASFHKEVLEIESSSEYLQRSLPRFFQQFKKEFNLTVDDIELEYIVTAEHGIRRELVRKFLEKPKAKSILELVDFMLICRVRLFQVDEKIMRSYLQQAAEFIRSHDFSHIKLL